MADGLRAKALLAEAARRDKFAAAVRAAVGELFDLQDRFVKSPHKRKVGRAGRRGGKTTSAECIALIEAAHFPGSTIPVFERTLTCSAAATFWKALQTFDTAHKLGIEFRHTAKEAILPNRSTIHLRGVDTLELADKSRGEPFPAAIIDECGTFRSHILQYLVDEVLSPSMIDYDGTIVGIGTPGPRKEGFWFEMCHSKAWEQHHWTLLDNPYLGKTSAQRTLAWRQAWLKEEILRKGWVPYEQWADAAPLDVIAACEHPTFKREYMGEWVDSLGELMYEFDYGRNTIERLPADDIRHPWRFGLGLDLGYEDPTAFTVTATRKNDPYLYVVESYEEQHLIPSTISTHIDRLKLRYGRFHFIVADTGGQGKPVVEEMIQRYGQHILPAKKTAKRVFVEHLNGDFRTGRVKIVAGANRDLCDQLYHLPWNDERDNSADGFPDHLPDSLLYNAREWATQLVGFGLHDGPREGTDEWWAAFEERLQQQADASAAAEEAIKRGDGYEIDDASF